MRNEKICNKKFSCITLRQKQKDKSKRKRNASRDKKICNQKD